MGELQWQAAQQAAMLRTSERYLALAVAQEQLACWAASSPPWTRPPPRRKTAST
jgi:hypothetical protein